MNGAIIDNHPPKKTIAPMPP